MWWAIGYAGIGIAVTVALTFWLDDLTWRERGWIVLLWPLALLIVIAEYVDYRDQTREGH